MTPTNELINQMIDNIAQGDSGQAQQDFSDIMSVKLTHVLDQRKQDIARQLGAHNVDVQAAA
jgi:hypothetical protein